MEVIEKIEQKQEMLRLLNEGSAYERFEVLEHYTKLTDTEADVLNLVKILESDTDPIVRHEAAAQLLNLETAKPLVMAPIRNIICAALLNTIYNDSSIIVKHEAMEALAYIGDENELAALESFVDDQNMDIRFTARIAYDMLRFRLEKGVRASDLATAIMAEAL